MKLSALAAVALVSVAMPSFAQQATTVPATVPAMECGSVPDLPSSRMMEERMIRTRFERDIKIYGDCVKKYVAERQKSLSELQAQAKAHADAGTKAANDYNALMKGLNEAAK